MSKTVLLENYKDSLLCRLNLFSAGVVKVWYSIVCNTLEGVFYHMIKPSVLDMKERQCLR